MNFPLSGTKEVVSDCMIRHFIHRTLSKLSTTLGTNERGVHLLGHFQYMVSKLNVYNGGQTVSFTASGSTTSTDQVDRIPCFLIGSFTC